MSVSHRWSNSAHRINDHFSIICKVLSFSCEFLNLSNAFNGRFLCRKTGEVILKMQIAPFVKFWGALFMKKKLPWIRSGKRDGSSFVSNLYIGINKQHIQIKYFGVLSLLGWRAAKNVPQVCFLVKNRGFSPLCVLWARKGKGEGLLWQC